MAGFDLTAPVVLELPGMAAAEVRAGVVYHRVDGRDLAMDVYLPPDRSGPVPAVLLVHGEADPAPLRGVRGWGQYAGWGRLLAAGGLAWIVAEHQAIREAGLVAVDRQVAAALAAAADLAGELGLDPDRLVRAGRDHPELNATVDAFVAAALAANRPLELVTHPDGHHAFDTVDPTDASRRVIRRVLAFLGDHLAASSARG